MKRLSKFSSYIIFLFVFILLYNTSSFAIVHPGEYNEQFKFSEFQLQSQTYYVQSGDSLYSIAQQFGVSIADIKRINNISNVIYPGQQLIIPGAQNQLIYRVQTGDSLYKIASRFNVTVASIRNANKLSSDWLVPGQELMIPGTGADAIINNNITIVVDAGHGGYDPGAVTYYNSRLVKESDLVLDIASRLVSLLNEAGYNAVVTRTGDYNVALWRRVQMAYQHNADLFISIHADNSPPNPGTRGSNVYISPYADWNTYQLADSVQRNLKQTTGRPANYLGRVIREPFTVLMQSRPGILVETGFLSNWQDLNGFHSAQFRYLLARGIFKGIEQWIN